MKKIFVLTGEPSGDKLASKAISKLKTKNNEISYLSVGGENLKNLGIESLYDLNEITFLGFTKVILNIFKIKKKINYTVDKIIEFNPDILFSVDSSDFTLRISKRVKIIKPKIKTIHFVAPKVYVWRERRVKKLKYFLDHMLLLFPFEKKYFDKENLKSTFVGHPLLDVTNSTNTDNYKLNTNKEKIISIFPGSRLSEIKSLMPILIKFIILTQKKGEDYKFVFHTIEHLKNYLSNFLVKAAIKNYEVISDDVIKKNKLSETSFAIVKSGTISLEICNAGLPSLIIYKMNFINFFIIKLLVKIKFANILNIMANDEIIPELIQSDCNHNKIYQVFNEYMTKPNLRKNQIDSFNKILKKMKTNGTSSEKIATILNDEIKNL